MSEVVILLGIVGFVVFQIWRMARIARARRESEAHRQALFMAALLAQRAQQAKS